MKCEGRIKTNKISIERNLLYCLFPVSSKNKLPYTTPDEEFSIDGNNFNEKNFMILDVIQTMFLKCWFATYNNGTFPKNIYENKKIFDLENTPERLKNVSINIDTYSLYNDFNFLRNIKIKKLNDLIINTSKCKFKVKDYRIKEYDEQPRGKLKYKYSTYSSDEYESLFNIEEIIKTKNKNKIINIEYKISFKNKLSNFMIYNLAMLNVEWMPLNIYNLSKNAQFIFRRCLQCKKKHTVIDISTDELKYFLHINYSNITMVNNQIKKILKELEERNIIEWSFKKCFYNTYYNIEKLIS